MRDIRVAAVQMEHVAGDKQANFAKIERFAQQAAAERVELLVFPECCITGYWFLRNLSRQELQNLAEHVPEGPSTERLLRLSQQHRMTIGAGLVEIDAAGRMYNSYIVAMPDGTHRTHRKIQAFESDFISAGDAYTVFDTPHGCRAGVLVCYDNNIIENTRMTALQGAEILLAPHQTGGCDSASPQAMKPVDKSIWADRAQNPEALEAEFRGPKGREWLLRWLPSRAHDNGMFLIFSNGVGVDDDEIRTGNAMILDPYGRIIAESSKCCDDMVIADLKASLLDKCTGQRWIRARRPELYGPLAQPTGKEKPTRRIRFDK
jgi:predicted amidohydrolase